MANTSNNPDGPRRSNKNRGNRNRKGSRNRNNRSNQNNRNRRPRNRKSGGGRSGSHYRSKMPRPGKPSLWLRFLHAVSFGMLGMPAMPERNLGATSHPAEKKDSTQRTGNQKTRNKPAAKKQARKPRITEVTSGRLYVGNLSFDASDSDLLELFGGIGKVSKAEVVYHSKTQRSKGYAFVEFLSMDDAKRAVEELHDKEYMGRKLLVSGAKRSRPRTGGDQAA